MKWSWKKGIQALSLLALLVMSACGGQPAALPPPAANPWAVGGYNGTCAGGVPNAGQPLSTQALNATLTDNGNNVVGSVQLFLYLTGQFAATDPYPTIVGSGSIAFTNSSYLYGGYANYSGVPQQTSFCISSQDPTGGGILSGVYSQGDASFAISMKGITQFPSINPWSGMPTGAGSSQPITISIGYDCGTYLSGNTRFQGCVRLDMGGGYGTILWAN